MKKFITLILILALGSLTICKASQQSIGLMTQYPTDYIVSEPNNVEITRSVNQSYSFFQNGKIGVIDLVDDKNVTCMTQSDAGDLYVGTGPERTYASITINDTKISITGKYVCTDSLCDYSQDYNQSSYGPHLVTRCQNSDGDKIYEVFDTNINKCASFKIESKFVAPGNSKFFALYNQEIGYFKWDDPENYIKIADAPGLREGAIRPMNNSKFIVYSSYYTIKVFDLEGNSGPEQEVGRVLTGIPEQLFVLDQNYSTIIQILILDDLSIQKIYIPSWGSFTDFDDNFLNAPNFFYQTTKNSNTTMTLVYDGLNTYYSQNKTFFYQTVSSESQRFLQRNFLRANVGGYIRDSQVTQDKKRSIQIYPNGFLTIFDPEKPYPSRDIKFSPVNAFYFIEDEVITVSIDLTNNNCSLSTIDLEQANSTTYTFHNCPKFEDIDQFETYNNILAYDSATVSAYVEQYPYIFKATQRDVDYVIDEDFTGFDLQGYEVDEKFFVIGTPKGQKFQTMAWVFNANTGELIKKGSAPDTKVQVFITNDYAIGAKSLGGNNYLFTRTDLQNIKNTISNTVKGLNGIKQVLQLNDKDTIILDDDDTILRCSNLKNCENIEYDNVLDNARIYYRSSNSFNLKNGVNGFGTYNTIELSDVESSIVDIDEEGEDSFDELIYDEN